LTHTYSRRQEFFNAVGLDSAADPLLEATFQAGFSRDNLNALLPKLKARGNLGLVASSELGLVNDVADSFSPPLFFDMISNSFHSPVLLRLLSEAGERTGRRRTQVSTT